MTRLRHALAIAVLAAATVCAAPTVSGAWDGAAFTRVQEKGRPGADRGDRGERERDRGREARQERQADRRDRMSEDDRRSLHRDLDKANRELYGRRLPK